MFFVSKFDRSKMNSLPTASIWSIASIYTCSSIIFFLSIQFFIELLYILNRLNFWCQIGLKWTKIWISLNWDYYSIIRGGTTESWGKSFDTTMPTQCANHGGTFTLTLSNKKMVKNYVTILAFAAFICVLSNATFLPEILIYKSSFPW